MSFYDEFAQPAMIALARAGNRGCRVDTVLREKYALQAQEAADGALQKLKGIVGHDLNPDSPKQCNQFLYQELRLPEQRKPTKGGHPGGVTSDEEAIQKLRLAFPQHTEVLTLILRYRGQAGRATTMRLPLQKRPDGEYFVTSYNATGTKTGRISSSETILHEGGNLQNQLQDESRRVFVPRKGKVFVKGDGSQAEARVVAVLCQDTDLLTNFARPDFDIHSYRATQLFGGTVDEIKAEDKACKQAGLQNKSRRYKTKGVTHGGNYRGGPHVAQKQLEYEISYAEAKVAIEALRRSNPLLLAWWGRIEQMVRSTRAAYTTWGRLRIFLGRADEETFRQATAHEPQSTVGDLINHAFFTLDRSLRDGSWPLLQAHDEIVCECAPENAEETARELKRMLEWPMDFPVVGKVVVPAEIAIGENWYDLKAWKG